ncbi:hypothetical protein ACOZ4I_11030 [Haloarcula salina]|uniref:hypothetical protein n=1 Tax=Haloarcula salina TaxID=1429914 RepID=UPI003C70450E
MSVAGLCELCGRPEVDHGCDRCGQLVCDEHWSEDTGLCVECAADAGRPDDRRVPEDAPDGVDTYRF